MINFIFRLTNDLYLSVLLGLLLYAGLILDIVYIKKKPKNCIGFIVSIFTAVATAVTSALIGTVTMATALITGYVVGAVVAGAVLFGGVALSMTLGNKKADFGASSPTYANPTLQTQTNPDLPVPLLYGTVKLAGNRIWQDDNADTTIKRIVAFAEGQITSIDDIRLNDIQATKIKGIKIQRYYGSNSQSLPAGLSVSKVGSLKNIAYVYIEVPRSQDIDINYNLTALVKGRKVRVYTTPNDYTVEYSENPAWVLLDFLTSYNGRGLCLNDNGTVSVSKIAELFDLNSFIESANFCDETVLTEGVASKRFTFNMVFDSQTSHRTLLDEIYRNCRGVLAVKNGKLQFKIDKKELTKKVFNEADIIDGSETFQTLPQEEHYDILKIDYISPKHEWQKVQAFAEIPEYRSGVPIEHEVNCYSVTNFQQASRLAWYYINSKVLCPYFGSFQTGFKGADLEVGDVISIPVILMGLSDYLVKVTSVIDNGTGVYTVNYRNYDERLYTDQLGSYEAEALVTKLGDIYDYPRNVRNFNVVQKDNFYVFTWSYTSSTDMYEIRYGKTWENGEVIGRNIAVNTFSYQIRSKGLKRFWIKAKNDYNYSKSATMDMISISDIPQTNVVVSYNIIDDCSYDFYHTTKYRDKLKLRIDDSSEDDIDANIIDEDIDGNDLTDTLDGNHDTIFWHNTTDNWGEGDTYYQNGGLWGASVFSYGEYTSKVYDLTDILACYVSAEISEQVQILWRYSEDNIEWSEWQELLQGECLFRYSQYKLVFNSLDLQQIVCSSAIITVDVPDKFTTMDVDVTSTSGKLIEYNFIAPPSIVATVNDNLTAYAVIKNKTSTQANVLVYNNNGSATTGKVSLYIKGY